MIFVFSVDAVLGEKKCCPWIKKFSLLSIFAIPCYITTLSVDIYLLLFMLLTYYCLLLFKGGGLAQLVASFIASTKLTNTRPG